MKRSVCRALSMVVFCIGLAWAADDQPDALPRPVVRAWTETFPGTVILGVKSRVSNDLLLCELKLAERGESQGFEVIFDEAGVLIEEQRHAMKESEALKVLRFFALFGALDEPAQGVWTAEKQRNQPRHFTLTIEGCSVPGRFDAVVLADGKLNVTLDQRIKNEGALKPGKLEGRFQLAKGLTVLPAALVPKATASNAHPGGTPGAEEVPEEVLRKIRRLIRATLSEDNEEREEGWKQLRTMGGLAVPGLAAVARNKDTTPEMLNSLMIALGDSKDPRAGPTLVGLLKSANPLVRQGAARGIGDSGYKDALPALEGLATDLTEEEEVRLFAAISAAKLGSRTAFEALTMLSKSERHATRTRAIFALGKYGGKPYVEAVAAALDDSESVVRTDAVEALRLIGGDEVKVPLARAVADSDHRVRAAALAGLRAVSDQQPGPILAGALTSPNVKVRRAAAKVLGDLGYKEGVPNLEKALEDADESVRLHAAASAAKLGSGPALLTLKSLLKSTVFEVRAKALVSLGKFGGAAQVETVAAGLKDAEPKVRLAAVEGLSLIGDEGVVRLMDATADEDHLVREAALESLQALTGQEIGADPAAWRAWWKKSKETNP